MDCSHDTGEEGRGGEGEEGGWRGELINVTLLNISPELTQWKLSPRLSVTMGTSDYRYN